MHDPNRDNPDYVDFYFKHGYIFFVPSRLAWKNIKHKVIDSDYVIVECNDGPLERFTFRKV